MDSILFWLVPVASVLALCFTYYFHKQMMKESEGTPQMIKIAAAVRKGAMSYLKQQYKIVGWVFLGLVILFSIMAYGFHVQNAWVPIAFLTGGSFSGCGSRVSERIERIGTFADFFTQTGHFRVSACVIRNRAVSVRCQSDSQRRKHTDGSNADAVQPHTDIGKIAGSSQ